jgi:hypothetical protein
MNKFYFPVNLTPVLNVNFDFDNIVIAYSGKDKKENKILTKVISYEHNSILKLFDDLRVFLNAVKNQKINCFDICVESDKDFRNKEKLDGNHPIVLKENNFYENSKFDKKAIHLLKQSFDDIFKNNYISIAEITNFLNKINIIIEDYNIEFTEEELNSNKVQLHEYMFPKLKFDGNEHKFYLDQISINLKYQAYMKAKSKNKILLKEFKIEHIIHILNTFIKSLNAVLNYNLFSILKILKEKNMENPYIVVSIIIH